MTITYEQATKRVEKLGLVGKLYEDRYVICNKEGTRVAEISTKYFGESTSTS